DYYFYSALSAGSLRGEAFTMQPATLLQSVQHVPMMDALVRPDVTIQRFKQIAIQKGLYNWEQKLSAMHMEFNSQVKPEMDRLKSVVSMCHEALAAQAASRSVPAYS
ncbi:MAG: hypothetical protein K2Q01_08370, partial [Rickettsiales bacterium]|nr:hypothetical protein [Rickettsiales bacterium]